MIEIVKTNNEDSVDVFCAKLSSQRFARDFLNFKAHAEAKAKGVDRSTVQVTVSKVNNLAGKIYQWALSDSKKEFDKKMNALHFSFDLIKDNFGTDYSKRVSFASLTSGASKLLSFAEGQ